MKKIHSSGGSGSESSRKGIALVVVLGFLAILTLMAVGMAISMRTERLASSSYLDMVKARMYCQAGLADSMVMLEDILQHPNTPPQHVVAPNYRYYYAAEAEDDEDYTVADKEYAVFASIAPTSYPGDSEADIFTNSLIHGTATNFWEYYPQNFWKVLSINEEYGIVLDQAQWIHVRRTNDQGRVLVNGRYMYIGLDVSGALDANYIGREHERPYQIAMSQLAQFGGYNNYTNFISARDDTNIRYETHKDLRNNSRQANPDQPFGLCTFSWCPPMRIVGSIDPDSHEVKFSDFNEGWPVYLSSNETEWSQTDIEAAFRVIVTNASWFGRPEAVNESDLYNLLEDYVDEDYKPFDLDKASIEPVPMVNEVYLTASNVTVELWEPFVGPKRYGQQPGQGECTVVVEVGENSDSEKKKIPVTQEHDPIDPFQVDVALTTPITNGVVDVTVSVSGTNEDGSTVVMDRVKLKDFQLRKYWQCNDPRFNHLYSQWKRNSDTGTMNNINANANYADRKNGETDGDYLMFCANRPLKVSGELGYLPVAPWRTIKLYEDPRDGDNGDMDRVLDYFTMQRRDEVKHGQISPNAVFPNPRRCALGIVRMVEDEGYRKQGLGLYIEQKSRENGGDRWRVDKPIARTDFYYAIGTRKGNWNDRMRANGTVATNIADVGQILYSRNNVVENFKDKSKSYSELRLEDPMRRASQTMNLRQNNILLFLWAQELGTEQIDPNDDDHYDYPVKAEAQAVALVWRDPHPVSNENQYHRKFVRYMRWME